MAKTKTRKRQEREEEAKAESQSASESPAAEHLAQRHAEEQRKMDEGAVKDVLLDPNFTPGLVGDDGAKSTEVPPENPDWQDKMRAHGKGDVPPIADAAPGEARSKDVRANRAGITRSSGSVPASAPVRPATKAEVKAASKGNRAKPAKAARTTKAATRKKAGTVKAGV